MPSHLENLCMQMFNNNPKKNLQNLQNLREKHLTHRNIDFMCNKEC